MRHKITDPLNPALLIGEQIPWWIVLRGRKGSEEINNSLIHGVSSQFRDVINRLIETNTRNGTKPDTWEGLAKIWGIRTSNFTDKGVENFPSVLDFIYFGGLFDVPIAEIFPKSYYDFILTATLNLIDQISSSGHQDIPIADVQRYAVYWSSNPVAPRRGYCESAIQKVSDQFGISIADAMDAVRSVSEVLEPILGRHKSQIAAAIQDEKLS